jgi:hypothetical protein
LKSVGDPRLLTKRYPSKSVAPLVKAASVQVTVPANDSPLLEIEKDAVVGVWKVRAIEYVKSPVEVPPDSKLAKHPDTFPDTDRLGTDDTVSKPWQESPSVIWSARADKTPRVSANATAANRTNTLARISSLLVCNLLFSRPRNPFEHSDPDGLLHYLGFRSCFRAI